MPMGSPLQCLRTLSGNNFVRPFQHLADVSDIFYFFLLGEGGKGSPRPPEGGGKIFY